MANQPLVKLELPGDWEEVEPSLFVKSYNDGKQFIEARTNGVTVRFAAKASCVVGGFLNAVQQVASAEVSNDDQEAIERAIATLEVELETSTRTTIL